MPRYLVRLQYLGTRYSGWQMQANGIGVQQVIEAALEPLMRDQPRRIEGSGRTDAGVHASAQYMHVDLPVPIRSDQLLAALKTRLPHDIRALDARLVDDAFHARFSAAGKSYRYRIWNGRFDDVFHRETHAGVILPLDESAMARAASLLTGTHDFRSFTVAGPEVSSTVRTVTAIEVTRSGPRIEIVVSANGFLRFMVRRIAGLLIEIGKGELPVEYARRCIEPELAIARWTAPARGLTLEHVAYPSLESSAT